MNTYTAFLSEHIQPIRFLRRCRPAARLAQHFASKIGRDAPSAVEFQELANEVSTAYNRALNDLTFELRPANMDVALGTLNLVAHVAQLIAHGRNIFALNAALVELLGRTDLSGVRLSDVHLPFPVFYVSFGDSCDLALPGAPNRVDGVYVNATTHRTLQLVVTCRRLESKSKSWVLGHEPYFYLPLSMETPDATFESAIEQAISVAEIPLVPDFEAIEEQRRAASALRKDGLPVSVPAVTAGERRAEFNQQGLDAARKAVALAVNAICYLTAAFDTISEPAPSSDTPPELVEATRSERKAARRAATARLLDDAWLPIRVVRLPSDHKASEQLGDSGGTKPPHWRRGHWRRQPVGAGREQSKLLWIRPTLVRGNLGEPTTAHLYLSTPRVGSDGEATVVDAAKNGPEVTTAH